MKKKQDLEYVHNTPKFVAEIHRRMNNGDLGRY